MIIVDKKMIKLLVLLISPVSWHNAMPLQSIFIYKLYMVAANFFEHISLYD